MQGCQPKGYALLVNSLCTWQKRQWWEKLARWSLGQIGKSPCALRAFYSLFAAVLSFYLHPNPVLIKSNALTQNLPSSGDWSYALFGVWERFDTLWYLRIAERGYDLPMSVISYPLYPGSIRLLSLAMPPIAAALVVATGATFFYFWGLLRLAETDLSKSGKFWMLLLVCVWPTSFILFAGYADSLTFALVVWSLRGKGDGGLRRYAEFWPD
jgi:hypothetical protein